MLLIYIYLTHIYVELCTLHMGGRGVAEVKKVGGTGTKQDVYVISGFVNELLPYTPFDFFFLDLEQYQIDFQIFYEKNNQFYYFLIKIIMPYIAIFCNRPICSDSVYI